VLWWLMRPFVGQAAGLPSGALWHWRPCPSCATAEATDMIRKSPFSPFPVRFTILVLA
jgi:hypothetical protein